MAAPKSRDPLDSLQVLLNDVLVQTGKALRASRRDNQGSLALPQGMSQSKLPVTIEAFHKALDDLEGDIMKAKSVILRDLNQLQADKPSQQQQLQPALPIESQTKEPISIDAESSPPPSTAAHTKPVPAPFPVMDAGDMTNNDSAVKSEDKPTSANNSAANNAVKTEATAAPEAPMMADSNFTDMEFSLAPADGSQSQNTNSAGSFDLSSFAPTDTMLSLDNLLPNNNGPSGDASASNNDSAPAEAANANATTAETKTESTNNGGNANDSNFEDFFTNDASQADGMDFDFSIGASGGGGGGGMGEDTFNDLMDDRDGGTFEMMTNEDFDAAFFGLDNKDGTS